MGDAEGLRPPPPSVSNFGDGEMRVGVASASRLNLLFEGLLPPLGRCAMPLGPCSHGP